MKLDDLFDYARYNSGNHLIPENSLEYTKDQFLSVLKVCLGIYNRYTPLVYQMNIYCNDLNYTFSGSEYPDYNKFNVKLIPDKISEIIPVYTTFTNPFSSWIQSQNGIELDNQGKYCFIWRYNKPVLHLDRTGEMDMTIIYRHPIIKSTDPDTGLKFWELPTIDESDIAFLNLMTGKFMIMLGRSRRLFSQSESPITIDYDGMISDGNNMEKESMEDIINNAKFYAAWG